ncbi:MAG: response regulator, partial [Ruthenibacterium sp.]
MISVLLVDDEILSRANLRSIVAWESLGFVICGEASNGREALEKAKQLRPQLVITDMMMPIMNGAELTQAIREIKLECMIIVLSNYDDFAYVKQTFQSGIFDYILKHNLSTQILTDILKKAQHALQQTNQRTDTLPLYPR